jgi:hypothetical protein
MPGVVAVNADCVLFATDVRPGGSEAASVAAQ